jgi:lysocardiolipin and lysophospholipid acyltransferase
MFGRFDGIFFASLVFFSSLLGALFILFPFIPLAFFAPRIFRFVCDRFVGYWLTFPASMLNFIFGVKFHVTGDLIEHSKPSLIIMNHRTRLDWMFFWNALYKMNPWLLTTEKISLKAGLKSIPGAGWAMGCGAYIFLNRSYELDQRILGTMIQYYKESLCSYQLLLFPEGTDRGERAARISDEFAKKNGLPKYDYVLHPRTTGFNFILNEMRKHDYIDAIYDVTVAYPDKIVPSEIDLITKGILPKNVHFDIKKYTLSDILTNEQKETFHRDPIDASQWLLNLWKEKEARLKKFYSTTPERRKLVPSGKGYAWPVETTGIGYYLAFFFWIITSALWIYFTLTIFWIKWYILFAISFYLYAQKYHGGAEFLFLEWFFGRRFFFEQTR